LKTQITVVTKKKDEVIQGLMNQMFAANQASASSGDFLDEFQKREI
jgi:hypothetical protein